MRRIIITGILVLFSILCLVPLVWLVASVAVFGVFALLSGVCKEDGDGEGQREDQPGSRPPSLQRD